VVYLMTDAEDRPVQLLCVRHLRNSLKRRLGPPDPSIPPSKRVDYRDLVRHIHYRRVDSDFEADLVYLAAARELFPNTYRDLVGFRPAWFLHVDPDAPFPRYTRTTDLSHPAGVLVGPLEDKQSASRLIELVESAFDLCRYHNVLVESPRGKPCAYKEMRRCPAPCDGSISLDQYRRMVELSCKVLVDPGDTVRAHETRMRQAAAELKFETAAKIKQYVDELSALGKGPNRFVRNLADFQFVSLQPGPPPGPSVKLFLITPGEITEEAALLPEPATASPRAHPGATAPLIRTLLERAESRRRPTLDAAAAERIGLVAAHLFRPRNRTNPFIRLADLDEGTLALAYNDISSAKSALPADATEHDAAVGDEGITRELQSD